MPSTQTVATSTIPDTIPAGYRLTSPKQRWPWILVGFAVVLGLIAVGWIAVIASAKNELAAQAGSEEITYEVSFDHPVQGGVLTTNIAVAYTDTDGRITQTTARTVPWRESVASSNSAPAAVTATNDDTNQTIMCTIRAGDTIIATHTASGPHASTVCAAPTAQN